MILGIKAFWITLCISALLMRPIFQFLLGLKSRQVISAFVPEGHQQKVGTPNMGGLIPVFGLIATLIYFGSLPMSLQIETLGQGPRNVLMTAVPGQTIWAVLSLLIGFTVLGFADDYVVPKMAPGKRGIEWIPKLLLQVGLAAPAAWFGSTGLNQAGLALFLILFFANAFNFSDGLDALAGSLLIGISVGLFALGWLSGSGITMVISAGLLGGIGPFLLLNAPPARVFMGDTGSLPIGGLLGFCFAKLAELPMKGAVVEFYGGMNTVLWYAALVILAGMMIAELVPVPIQIASVKLLKRKVFPFTPIHHAFEKAGWKETRVVWSFAIIQLFFTIAALTLAGISLGVGVAPVR